MRDTDKLFLVKEDDQKQREREKMIKEISKRKDDPDSINDFTVHKH